MEAFITVLFIIITWELIKYITRLLQSYIVRSKTNPFEDYCYMDANATTEIAPAALAEYIKTARLGNASAQYAKNFGDIPRILEDAKTLIGSWMGLDQNYQIIWNSGASEGNNYVIRAISDTPTKDGSIPHVVASSIEHKTSLDCLDQLSKAGRIQYTLVQPNYQGVIDPVAIAESIRPNTRLITVMHTNNELGTVNPIKQIGAIAARHGIFFHVDAVQGFGKDRILMAQNNIDALTASMHKVYGPQGVGLLVLSRRFAKTFPAAQIAGSQFDHLRGGTENIPGIAASAAALKSTWTDRASKNERLRKFKLMIVHALDQEFGLLPYVECYNQPDTFRVPGTGIRAIVLGETDPKYTYPAANTSPSTLLLSIVKMGNYHNDDRFCNINLKHALFDRKIIISIGSACNTGSSGPSHVLGAIKAPYIVRSGTIRISMSDLTTEDEVQTLIRNLISCIKKQG